MPKKPKTRRARLLDIPIFVDEPILVRFKIKDDIYIVAFAMPRTLRPDFENPFFGAEISDNQWKRYLLEYTDLRYLFKFPDYNRWFIFDFDSIDDDTVTLIPIDINYVNEEWFPGIGLFARHHTEKIDTPERASGQQEFSLDGNWNLDDLGHFRKKFGDLYAFYLAVYSIDRQDVSYSKKRQLIESFGHYPFQGGSSYLHLYNDLEKTQDMSEKLDMASIELNSPGFVVIRGHPETFDQLRHLVNRYLANYHNIHKKYKTLHSYLQKSGLLGTSASEYSGDTRWDTNIYEMAVALAEASLFPNPERVFRMTRNNPLAFAKVVLSFARRANDAFLFFAQGRIGFDNKSRS